MHRNGPYFAKICERSHKLLLLFIALAQEQNEMGRFLKEYGKADKSPGPSGKMMIQMGKSLQVFHLFSSLVVTVGLGVSSLSCIAQQPTRDCFETPIVEIIPGAYFIPTKMMHIRTMNF